MANIIQTVGITVTNETDVRGQALLALIAQYIPGFTGRYYGFRQFGNQDTPISFPAVFVEPKSQILKMVTTAKYHLLITYNLWFAAVDNSHENCLSLITSAAESLTKLLSNNALSDIGSGNSNKFKAYTPYWINSEMQAINITAEFQNAVPTSNSKYMRAGLIQYEIEDELLK